MQGKILKNKKISIPTLIVCLISAFFLLKGVLLQPDIEKNKEEIAKLNAEIAEQHKKLEELEELVKIVDTDEYIEKIAREKLGLIKENELIFIDVSGEQ